MINRTLCGTLGAAALATIATLSLAGTSSADPPDMLPDAPIHRHFIKTANGRFVPVGPNLCQYPDLQQAFNEFHYNIHHSEYPAPGQTPPVVSVPSLGPQNGAPGLHNNHGAEIVGVRGCVIQPG
jgi:hypothetical protein